jgi:hypothetical protein
MTTRILPINGEKSLTGKAIINKRSSMITLIQLLIVIPLILSSIIVMVLLPKPRLMWSTGGRGSSLQMDDFRNEPAKAERTTKCSICGVYRPISAPPCVHKC